MPPSATIAAKHGATLVIKPVNLGEMFKVSGQVPLAERPPVRQRYRLIELQRYADWRGMKLTLKPKFFPTNPTLADHTICAIIADGGDPLDYMASVFAAIWADERDIADEATLAEPAGGTRLRCRRRFWSAPRRPRSPPSGPEHRRGHRRTTPPACPAWC